MSLSNYYFIIPLIIYLLWLKKSFIFKISLYLSITLGFLFLQSIKIPSIERECLVIESNIDYSICKNKNKYILYETYAVGNYLHINGDYSLPSNATSPFTFNYNTYLKSKGIYYLVYKPEANIIKDKKTIYDIREFVKEYLDTFPYINKSYLSALIMGDKSLIDEKIISSMVNVGIIHLFAISGLHVGLLCIAIKKILEFLNVESDNIIIIFLVLYMLIAGFSVSVVRASLMFILAILNKKLSLPFSSLDILSITFILFIVINPLSILDIGFQLSFIVTLFLLLGNQIIKGDLLKQSLMVSLLAQLATLPIIINLNNQINILSVIFNIFFVLLMTYILLPMTFISLLKPLNDFYLEIILAFEKLVLLSNDLNIIIKIANLHVVFIIIYYLLLFIFLKNLENNILYKKFYLIFLMLFIPYINPFDSVYFIDVSQGDSTLFKSKFNSCNVLIDTGGKLESNITLNNVVPILNSLGTNKIDYFVLTHSHFDHVGGAIEILNNFEVKYLIVSKYNTGTLINDVIEYAKRRRIKIIEVTSGDYIGCSNEFKVLEPRRKYNSINNESIVLDINYSNKKWLLMGDSELRRFKINEIDILKAGHHGSKTSMDESLLEELNPKVSIISVGKNNYGLPSKSILELFLNNNIDLYRTDEKNTISYINIGNGIFLDTDSYNSIVLGKPKYL